MVIWLHQICIIQEALFLLLIMATPIDQPNLLYLIFANITVFTEIGHVNDYPSMHYFGNSRHTQQMLVYKILTEYFWKLQWKIVGTWCHSLMWFETIDIETQSTVKKNVIFDFAMHTISAHFSTFPIEKLLAWLQWWLVASSKPWNHINGIFFLFCMHSVKYLKSPSLIILKNNFTIFSAK